MYHQQIISVLQSKMKLGVQNKDAELSKEPEVGLDMWNLEEYIYKLYDEVSHNKETVTTVDTDIRDILEQN